MAEYVVKEVCKLKSTKIISYQCENCEGDFSYSITVRADAEKEEWTYRSGIENTRKKLAEIVYQKAYDELKDRIEIYKQDDGHEQCPNCGYTQSWMKSSASASRSCGLIGFLMLIISALLWLGVALLQHKINGILLIASAVILWFFSLIVMFFFVRNNPQKDPNKSFGEVDRKNTPIITWTEIEVDN